MHQTTHMSRRRELVFFDEANPRSLVSLVPEPVAAQLRKLRDSDDGHLLGLGERALMTELSRRGFHPEAMDQKIRLQFWLEYDAVQGEMRTSKMNMSYVVGLAIGKENFYKHYLTKPEKLALMVTPPIHYIEKLHEALDATSNYLVSLVERAEKFEFAKNGEANIKFMEFVARANKELYHRLRGTQVKEVAKPKAPETDLPPAAEVNQGDMVAARKARLDELRAQAARASGLSAPVPEAGVE